MTIHQIAERLNEKASNEGFQIAALPVLRKTYLFKKQLPSDIFTSKTIKDGKEKYAFHYGGRDEMQFNIGEELIGKKSYTRVGLCFSLESSRSLLNPVKELEPFRKRFNKCFETHPAFFKGVEMWYYQNNKRYGNFASQNIPDEWFQNGTFIAVGYLIEKPLSALDEIDLSEILLGFDNLLPIYKFCVLQSYSEFSKEKRIAKICWNENNWVSPSGLYGKSKDAKSHERVKVYGHEEWLFDFEKQIDGYHYALLQPVQNGRETFLNKFFDVRLYSHNSDTKENSWIGSIKNLEVISNDDAKEVYKHYKANGWLEEMANSIKLIDGDYQNFMQLEPHDCFNVRFKPEYAILDKPYKKVENFDSAIGTYHYQFVHDNLEAQPIIKEKSKKRNFKFSHGKSEKSLVDRISTRQKQIIQLEPIHDKIQEILYSHLVSEFGEEKVGMETRTGLATRIDISTEVDGFITLYEVKTYPSVTMSIREAIGQLFEYAFYPNPIDNLKEMIIVSHIPIEEVDKEYLELLRSKTSLNIFYQCVDPDKKIISEKI